MDDNWRAWVSDNHFGRWYLQRIYWRFFDEHIANSPYTAAELAAVPHGQETPRGLHVLPMGVNVTQFDPANRSDESRARLERFGGVRSGTPLLLYAGRVSPEKNIPLLAEMMDRPQSAGHRLVVAGTGPLADWLKQRLGDRATFLGHVLDAQALAELLAKVDLFVHPNPREPYGIGPLEAMASGTPVVVPSAGGVLSYANGKNAWIAEPTGEAFAACIQEALSDGFLREQRCKAALWTAQDLAWPKIAARFFALYEHLNETSAAPVDRRKRSTTERTFEPT